MLRFGFGPVKFALVRFESSRIFSARVPMRLYRFRGNVCTCAERIFRLGDYRRRNYIGIGMERVFGASRSGYLGDAKTKSEINGPRISVSGGNLSPIFAEKMIFSRPKRIDFLDDGLFSRFFYSHTIVYSLRV